MITGFNSMTTALTGMQTPMEYFHQIIGYIPQTINNLTYRLQQPIVIVFVILVLVVGFLTAISK